MDSLFLKDKNFYKRNINPLKNYIHQNSFYLSKMEGIDINEGKRFIITNIKNGNIRFENPVVKYYLRGDNYDKEIAEISLKEYIEQVINNEEYLAPSFTTYLNRKILTSPIATFSEFNTIVRSKAKKEAFAAKMNKDFDLFDTKDNEQSVKKLYNNALSGGLVSEGCVLQNPSGHSTLTSATRTECAVGIATIEKAVAGGRHYYSLDIILENMISICSTINSEDVSFIMKKYNLYYPNNSDVLCVIKDSSKFYLSPTIDYSEICSFIEKMTPEEKAGFVYIGDFIQLRNFNPGFVKALFYNIKNRSIQVYNRDNNTSGISNPKEYLRTSDQAIVNLVHELNLDITRGIGKNYDLLNDVQLNTLSSHVFSLYNLLGELKDFIDVFLLTNVLPSSIAYLPNIVRQVVMRSDTDSVIFSTDEWIEYFHDYFYVTDESIGTSAIITYFSTEMVSHSLALLSANFGAEPDFVNKVAMKPEFFFSVFAETDIAKHYFAVINMQEGNIYDEASYEHKGVHLKNSALPKDIIKGSEKKMNEILNKVYNGEKISLVDELKDLADLERYIIKQIHIGNAEYFGRSKIKDSESYVKSSNESPYQNHLLWMEVFSKKYGHMDPPYDVIKIPTILENKTAIKNYLDSIEDSYIKENLSNWLVKQKKTSLPTMYVCKDLVSANGIPSEIIPIIDMNKILLTLTLSRRILLSSLGYVIKEDYTAIMLGY